MNLMQEIKSIVAKSNPHAAIYSESNFLKKKFESFAPMSVPMMNVALSGRWNGGLIPGVTVLAGESKMGKTYIGLLCVKAYLEKYENAICVYVDSEAGAGTQYFERLGIATDRVLHIPVGTIEEAKFTLAKIFDELKKTKDEEDVRCVVFFDSLGNIASKKECEDAIDGKVVADMTRAKGIKSFFRVVTPYINLLSIPMIVVAHTYKTQDLFPRDIVSGGCLVRGTKVLTPEGSKRIESFVPGDTVVGMNGTDETVKFVWDETTLETPFPPCLRIKTRHGVIECSEHHRFMVNGQWKEARQLRGGFTLSRIDGTTTEVLEVREIGKKEVFDLLVEPSHSYVLENGIISHNSGAVYSADTIFILTKSKETGSDKSDITGFTFKLKVNKSRFVKEGSVFELGSDFVDGIDTFSDLFSWSLSHGYILSPTKGFYQKNAKYGDEKRYRKSEIERNEEFWKDLVNDPEFITAYEKSYAI